MTDPLESLPVSPGLDVGALSRLFDDTTNSYKYLFFAALLADFKGSDFKVQKFTIDDLTFGMLAAAWYPVRYYRLSLGARDKVDVIMRDPKLAFDRPPPPVQLRPAIAAADPETDGLQRYVPYRLIAPFFVDQLRGVADHQRNDRIKVLSVQSFHAIRPLYRFGFGDDVELHPAWAKYLAGNFPIVSAWAERRWISYLQSRNPMVPAVSEKTVAPAARTPLTAQRRYWRNIISTWPERPKCVYSGADIYPDRFDLDHFLPWTFVCHDALWNLLPVSPRANSAKGNRLPDHSYLPLFATEQHRGLTTAKRIMTTEEWETATTPFLGDLRLSERDLLDPGALSNAYMRLVGAQLDIARSIGFEPGWRL